MIRDSEVIYIDVSEKISKYLLQIELSSLLLPRLLFPDRSNNGLEQLNVEDAKTILSTLNSWINHFEKQGNKLDKLKPILKQFLELSKNNIISILSENPDWRCLIGTPDLQETSVFYSYRQFEEFKRQSVLFKQSNNNLIKSLVEATENIQPIIVDAEIADLLKNDPTICPVLCNLDICKNILSKTPSLAELNYRTQLLTELLKEVH